MMKLITLLALILLSGGCEVLGISRNCDLVLEYAMRVTVVDSLTAGPVNELATVVFVDGSFADTAKLSAGPGVDGEPRTAYLDHDRPGTYDVRVTAADYLPWVATDIVVGFDGCHAETAVDTARLRRPNN